MTTTHNQTQVKPVGVGKMRYQCHPADEVLPGLKLIDPAKTLSLGHMSAVLADVLGCTLSQRHTTQLQLVKQSIDHLLWYRCAQTRRYVQRKKMSNYYGVTKNNIAKVPFKQIQPTETVS